MGVDGLPFADVVSPVSSTELAKFLNEANSDGRAVTPVGGGTKLALGNIPTHVDLAISTEHLDRVLHYEPTDMTLSVEAGARFADVQARLAERGQTLPLDVADGDRATIGGLIATAFAGPRRFGSGTLRDLLIGISVAYPDGSIGKAGGMVVKNVTGFDLMRLHLGALGTLGIVLSANFKVLPEARSEATLLSEPSSLTDALTIAAGARGGRHRPIALEVFSDGDGWQCAARLEGRPQTVALGTAILRDTGSWSRSLADEESRDWWRSYGSSLSIADDSSILIRCAAAPKASDGLFAAVETALTRQEMLRSLRRGSPGIGSLNIRIAGDGVSAESLTHLQASLLATSDTVTVLSAPPSLKRGIDVWGHTPTTISVMRALKAEFDPKSTLNPGRFVDRI